MLAYNRSFGKKFTVKVTFAESICVLSISFYHNFFKIKIIIEYPCKLKSDHTVSTRLSGKVSNNMSTHDSKKRVISDQ